MSSALEPEFIEIEWRFTPPDFFEERCELAYAGRSLTIEEGKVLVRTEISGGRPVWQTVANELHQVVSAQFLAAQVLSHERFTLSRPHFSRIRSDGGRDIFVFYEERLTAKMGRLDVAYTDASGALVRDSRSERVRHRKSFAELAAAHVSEPLVEAILRSYGAAVNDPGNELVHLYEIRDALADHFGGGAAAYTALGVPESAWRRLGELANSEPLIEGRHRGKHPGQLREATEPELEEARRTARALIEAYLAYLSASR